MILNSNIDVQKAIFTDENFFSLISSPNRQNTRFWSVEIPFVREESVSQGAQKLMVWAFGRATACLLVQGGHFEARL